MDVRENGGDRDQHPSRWRTVASVTTIFVLSCGTFLLSTVLIKLPPAWRSFEFCQYAEIGRNLAREGSFDTSLVEPMALAYIDRHGAVAAEKRWPVVNRYPLPCFVIASLMRLFGASDIVAAWSNGVAIGLLAALSYFLAWRWYGAGWAAVVGLLFLANPSFYGSFVLLGTPDIWFALFLVTELWVLARTLESPTFHVGSSVLLGALAGLAYLTRFNAILFLGIQAVVLLSQRRWREVLVASATGLVVVSPLFIYNIYRFGIPIVSIYSTWNLLDGTGAYKVEPWLYYDVPQLARQVGAHGSGLFHKVALNLFRIVPVRIWSLWHLLVLLPLAFVALAIDRTGSTRTRFFTWAISLFVVQLVVFSALRLELEDRLSPYHGRYFFWFAAPALLMAVGLLRHLAGVSRWRHALAFALIGVQLVIFGLTWSRWVADRHAVTNLGNDPIRRMLSGTLPSDQVVASNQPQILVWCAGLKAISMPADPEQFERLNRESPTPVDSIFLDLNYNSTHLALGWSSLVRPIPGHPSPWEAYLLRRYEYVIPPQKTRPLGYVLLRRRERPVSSGGETPDRWQTPG